MYFLNIKGVKRALVDKKVTMGEQARYIIGLIVLLTLFSGSATLPQREWMMLGKILIIVLSVFGVAQAYKVNGGDSGEGFMLKTLVLGWVLFWRFFLLTLLGVVAYLTSRILYPEYVEAYDFNQVSYKFLFITLYEILFFWRLCVHIGDITEKDGQPISMKSLGE